MKLLGSFFFQQIKEILDCGTEATVQTGFQACLLAQVMFNAIGLLVKSISTDSFLF